LPPFLESLIDKAVSIDFIVEKLDIHDYENENYKSLKYSLEFSGVNILYERKVISKIAPVVPTVQYLFGFPPVDGLCIFTQNKIHKKILCGDEFSKIFQNSTSCVHKLQYLLVEKDRFRVWSYFPLDPENNNLKDYELTLEMRKTLFTN